MARKRLWKTLREGLKSNYDGSRWVIGEWRSANPPTKECCGLNASPRLIDAMQYVAPEMVALVETGGKVIKGKDKHTCEKMRIVKAWKWGKRDSVALSIFAAELVLKNFEAIFPEDDRPRKAIEAAKKYLEDPTEENKNAAESAAWSAAESAAWSAWSAESAARSAAESAAESAARSAWSAAWSAAESAAWFARSAESAAESAARSAAESAARSAWSAAWSAADDCLDKIEAWLMERVKTLQEVR